MPNAQHAECQSLTDIVSDNQLELIQAINLETQFIGLKQSNKINKFDMRYAICDISRPIQR